MSRIRSSMLLLGICVVAILIGVLRLLTDQVQLPPASSSSPQPDGALALYTWLQQQDASPPVRLSSIAIDPSVGSVLILQPQHVIDSATHAALDEVADRGGTLVLAGDSLQWLLDARALDVTVEPTSPLLAPVTSPQLDLRVPLAARYRLRSSDPGARPLLVRDDGAWLALSQPYRQGTLIVVASTAPFTNAGLADDATARFVYRLVVRPLASSASTIAFDEIDRGGPSSGPSPASIDQLLYQTAPGRAVLFAALIVFVYLFSSGRRLGPPVLVRSATETPRTMYEHVQMLADLYRRAGQLAVVREAFVRHYAHGDRGTVDELARLSAAHTEADLIAAVVAIDDEVSVGSGSLSRTRQ